MRVIAGKARSLPLKTVPGLQTRPTTDRIKETLFNMLNPYLADARFLDLFAGSGAIGIEALSRGAAEAVFVDDSAACCGVIKQNLAFTRLEENARVFRADVLNAIARLEAEEKPFDVIFMDPPYASSGVVQVLRRLEQSCLAGPGTLIVFEEALAFPSEEAAGSGYEILKEKTYKSNKHVWLKKRG